MPLPVPTMGSIDSLLNHAARPSTPPPPAVHTTTYAAADALTTLATLGSGQQYAPAPHAPVEPDPPAEPPAVPSPTLDQYHHAAQAPREQKRRQSLMARSSPAPVLAPIQHLSTALHAPVAETPAPAPLGDASPDHADAARVKQEPAATPPASASTPAATAAAAENVGSDTLKALEIAKQADLGLRTKRPASVADSLPSPVESKMPMPTLPSKKRSAPASASLRKKGMAKPMKPSKKRKLDPEDATARSVTPTSRPSKPSKHGKKGSQAGTPGLESSPAPDHSSQGHASDDEGDSSEDHNLYCICKKPDNHRWMIGCDGGCDDWFHGDCINMKQADEELVDKFICPSCEENGRGHTTWKPMCRRDGCRKPARVAKERESKYCTDACGALFMAEQLQRTAGAKGANAAKSKRAKKKGGKAEDEAEEDEPTPLGGVLRSKDLKALVDASPNIQAFKNLGTGVLTPPQTASPNRATFDGIDGFALTTGERERLSALYNEKSQLKDRLEVLKDREKFVSMAKEQAVRVAEREKIKMKEFCGYDSRLSWSDAEFLQWRNSGHGQAAFKFSTLSPTTEQIDSMPSSSPAPDANKESVCLKKRCPKHPQWQKLNLQDARFEELEVVEAMKECEKEEKSVRERARRRGAKDAMAKELTAGEGNEERNRDGWVEVVAS
ncbi:COMPASS (complex proteins associated with Set1p) component [Pleosporales sp. CAS-2024a]